MCYAIVYTRTTYIYTHLFCLAHSLLCVVNRRTIHVEGQRMPVAQEKMICLCCGEEIVGDCDRRKVGSASSISFTGIRNYVNY